VDSVEVHAVFLKEFEGVTVVEVERIVFLGVDVDPGDFESGAVVARAGAACPAEKVE
jgi:hypothetical protein